MIISTPWLVAIVGLDALSWGLTIRRYRKERAQWIDLCTKLRAELENDGSVLGLPTNALAFLRDQAGKSPEEIDAYEFAYQSGLGYHAMGDGLLDAAKEKMERAGLAMDRLIASGDKLWEENIDLHSALMSARAWNSAARAFLMDGKIGEHQLAMLDIILAVDATDEDEEPRFTGVELWECVTHNKSGSIWDVEIAFGETQAQRWLDDRHAEADGHKPIGEDEQAYHTEGRWFSIDKVALVPFSLRSLLADEGEAG